MTTHDKKVCPSCCCKEPKFRINHAGNCPMTNPTPEETTRAGALAPEIARIAGLIYVRLGVAKLPAFDFIRSVGYAKAEPVHVLDPRALAAVVSALPRVAHHRAWGAVVSKWSAGYERHEISLPLLAWLLTPSGTLAFYEAVLAVVGEDGE